MLTRVGNFFSSLCIFSGVHHAFLGAWHKGYTVLKLYPDKIQIL